MGSEVFGIDGEGGAVVGRRFAIFYVLAVGIGEQAPAVLTRFFRIGTAILQRLASMARLGD